VDTTWKLDFIACSPQGFTATRCSKINVYAYFLSIQAFHNQVLFFEKYYFDQILVEQRNSEVLLKKACHFPEFVFSKIRKKLRIFEIDSCFTKVHTQKLILEQKNFVQSCRLIFQNLAFEPILGQFQTLSRKTIRDRDTKFTSLGNGFLCTGY
jgi:hypothetical protein